MHWIVLLFLQCLLIFSTTYSQHSISEASPHKTICLNMIVKNESQIIKRCLASVKPLIDYWVIVDTGSSDGTQQIIEDFMKEIPGELYQSEWVNFEHNRNEALVLAKNKSDYLLFLDADEMLIFSDAFVKPSLDKDCYIASVEESDGLHYQRPLLVKASLDWKWEGVMHEFITSSQAKSFEHLKGIVNYSNTEDGARFQDPHKYQNDAQILEKALLQDPSNARYTFYLAQSYANAQDYPKALENYQKRVVMGGFDQEVFWSLYCIGQLYEVMQESEETIIQSFWKAFQYRPSRAEPLFRLINHYLQRENYATGYALSKYALSIPIPNDTVFVDHRIYNYALLEQFISCAYLMGKYEEASQAIEQLLARPGLPQELRTRMENNRSILKARLPAEKRSPRVSIITSVWNGDLFIEGFLADITRQTIFNECELILINANSPGSEDRVIERYMARYPNIIYLKLPFDPGLYGVWNYAIRMASAPFITNANLDDRNRIDCLERHLKALEADPTVDLVYSAYYLTKIPNETYEHNHYHAGVNPPEFSLRNMFYCLPGPRPMWRKSLHERYGLFSEIFSSAGDYEMWLRAASRGAKFKKIPGVNSLIYVNPKGLSTDEDPEKAHQRQIELELIAAKYSYLYGDFSSLPPPQAPTED